MTRRLALAALVLTIAAACVPNQPSNELVLGAIYPLSGPQAPGGRAELAGVEAALKVSQANLRLQVIDAATPEAAISSVDKLVHDYHVPAILGTYASTLSAAASARAEELKTVYWETGAVADPITAQRHYVFRTVATGSALGRIAVTFTHDVLLPQSKLSSPRAAIVHTSDIYGRSVGAGEEEMARNLGIDLAVIVEYSPNAFSADDIALTLARQHADYLWDVSYLDDGVAIWRAVLRNHVPLQAAIGTSSAFCMPEFGRLLGSDAVGVYAADKPDDDISAAALSPKARALLAKAKAAYGGASMDIPAVAGFVGGWTLFHDVLSKLSGSVNAESIRTTALNLDVPVGDSINGGGVKFAGAGALDQGQNTRSAAVVGQWQSVGVMRIVYPAAYAG